MILGVSELPKASSGRGASLSLEPPWRRPVRRVLLNMKTYLHKRFRQGIPACDFSTHFRRHNCQVKIQEQMAALIKEKLKDGSWNMAILHQWAITDGTTIPFEFWEKPMQQ